MTYEIVYIQRPVNSKRYWGDQHVEEVEADTAADAIAELIGREAYRLLVTTVVGIREVEVLA